MTKWLLQGSELGQQRAFLCGGMHVCPSFYAVVSLVQQERVLDHRDPLCPSDSKDHPCPGIVVVVAVVAVAGLVAGPGQGSNLLLSRLAGIPSRGLVRPVDGIFVLSVLSHLVLPVA